MEQPVTLKQNGQINIVLDRSNSGPKPKKHPAAMAVPVRKPAPAPEPLKRIEEKLDGLVGLSEMKTNVKEIYAWLNMCQKREALGLKTGRQSMHMLFKGNPGTGKTTVARLLAELFAELNVLSKGHLIEAERADLVGEYIGHTAQKTRDLVKKAQGGILFIDEAYSLARGGEKDFGKEAIDTLVKSMEDHKDTFILILAGYSNEMEHFLSLNPGLPSRFPIVIDFPDYTVSQLLEIAGKMMEERQYVFSGEAEHKLKEHLKQLQVGAAGEAFSNARYIRNIIEKSIRAHAMRLLMDEQADKTELMTVRSHDLRLPAK
ncbi:stage V sporulation protein K [Bacillus marinisedimentorum]|uniref:stage V sporulation protein K n=1 Tax=Bacillus marinisedimentorum TaxID=1821260 RepID=UPI0007E15CC0|nr:stage V sporulation protein K [Bacillus marinisedimentorum]